MPEKQDVRQGDQDDLLDQGVAKRVHGMIDEDAAVVKRNDADADREARLNLIDLLLDGCDHLASVGSVADDDHSAYRFLAVLVEDAAAEFRTELDAGDVADRDRRAVVGAERDVFDVLEAADEADATDHLFRVADLHDLGADVIVGALHGSDDILERDVVGAEFYGIEVDLVLPDEAAHAGHLGDARHGVELVFNEPVLQGMQRAAVVGSLNRIPEDLADAGGVWTHHGSDAGGQEAAGQREAFEHARAGKVDVDGVLEDDVDHREAEGRLRPHGAHVRQALQVDREGIRDLVFDFLRTPAGPIGKDDDLVFAQVRNGVDGRAQERPVSPAGQSGVHGQHQPAILQRKLDHAVDHGVLLICIQVGAQGGEDGAGPAGLDGDAP